MEAIDGTYIPIMALLINKEYLFNRKGFYSINEMAICNGKKVFTINILKFIITIYIKSNIISEDIKSKN